jgi:hypothetical protein
MWAFITTAFANTIPHLNGMLLRTHAWSLQTDMDMDVDMGILCDIQAPRPCYVVIYSLKIEKRSKSCLDYDLNIPL